MRKRLKKKAIFFTIDALIASMILLGGILITSSLFVTKQPSLALNYISQDVSNILSTVRLEELDNELVTILYNQGNITDLNLTILEQIGEFYAKGYSKMAENFTLNVTQALIPNQLGVGIYMQKNSVFARDFPPQTNVVTYKKIISGIEENRPIKGFVATARATNVIRNSTMVVPMNPSGAGWGGQYCWSCWWWWCSWQWDSSTNANVQIRKSFEMPDVTINDVIFYLSIHADNNDPDVEYNINGNPACTWDKGDANWDYNAEGDYGYIDATGCLVADDWNYFEFTTLENDGYNSHLHPGTRLVINYTEQTTPSLLSDTISKRYYFDRIISEEGNPVWCGNCESGAWGSVAFHIPPEATNVNVGIKVVGDDIDDVAGEWDYRIYVNDDDFFDEDNTPASPVAEYTYTPAQLAGEIVSGTNLVTVYFSNSGDSHWGPGDTEIYSDPPNDPDGSSFVEVNYSYVPPIEYGVIEVSQSQLYGGNPNRDKRASWSFPPEAEEIAEVYTMIAQQYSNFVEVTGGTSNPPPGGNMAFETPSSRGVPTEVYIPKEFLDISDTATNTVRIYDTGGNPVIGSSTIDYSFYVPSFVGYGDVFNNTQNATYDALIRLNATLGPYINAEDIVVDSFSQTDVPSLWGPTVMEVRVWT